MKRRLYFAYGSNLSVAQMRHRCPGSKLVGVGMLPEHTICFRGRGVASVVRSVEHIVEGALYSLTPDDLYRLDGFEGYPIVYDRAVRLIHTPDGRRVRALVYMNTSAKFAAPTFRYSGLIKHCYRAYGFDLWPLKLAERGFW